MAVLTESQYRNKIKKIPSPEKIEESVSIKVEEFLKPKKDIYEYKLLHPENGAGGDLQNFEDVIILYDKSYDRKCVNGIITTKEEELAGFLIDKGYLVMEKTKL